MSIRNLTLALTSAVALVATSPLALANIPTHHDTRIAVTLVNHNQQFRDVKINGQSYTVEPLQQLRVLAPAGTAILSDCNMQQTHRGDLIIQLSAANNHAQIELK